MMIWTLEVEDVACLIDDMDKMDVFTCLGSESKRMELWEGEQGHSVGADGRVEDADGARLWRPRGRGVDAVQVTT